MIVLNLKESEKVLIDTAFRRLDEAQKNKEKILYPYIQKIILLVLKDKQFSSGISFSIINTEVLKIDERVDTKDIVRILDNLVHGNKAEKSSNTVPKFRLAQDY